ncbi:MAG: hypothetical protein QW783_03435 [Candidatus Micrarchaeia archaeon]
MKKQILFLLLLSQFLFADTTTTTNQLENAICAVYNLIKDVLPVMAFVLFVLAGVAYAAGNFFGAEMRAKATGWAMNMITGAIIALILSAVAPSILGKLYGKSFTACGVNIPY